jgi:hypothetical protein
MTAMCAGVYYNWQFARGNGFLNWVFLGEIVPSAKALIWPYFAFVANSDSKSPSPEDAEIARYFVSGGQVIEEYQKQETALTLQANKIAEIFDSREKTDPDGARLYLADSMDVLLQGVQPTVEKLERINPPKRLREHYDLLLGCPKTQIAAMGGMAAALRRKDGATYATQMTAFQSSLQDCTGIGLLNRARAALERAGYHSPDDINKAIAKGGLK